MAAAPLIAQWFVILTFCAGLPQVCELYAWPLPLTTQMACTRFGVTLADIYEASGFTCRDHIPAGVQLLPGPAERWAEEQAPWTAVFYRKIPTG